MAEREGYDDGNDAIVGGVLTPPRLQGGPANLHAELLSDRLFAALWPTMFAKIERAYDLVKAPPEDVAGAATMATWCAVDDVLATRTERHAAARFRKARAAEGLDA